MPHAFLTVDLGFGDAGKGSIVDFLARHYAAHTVVRYNGGAQAGHQLVLGQRLALGQRAEGAAPLAAPGWFDPRHGRAHGS